MNKKRAPENIGLNQIKKPTEDIHWFSSLAQAAGIRWFTGRVRHLPRRRRPSIS